MDAQAIQKHSRLPRTATLAALSLGLVSGCARSLKSEHDLSQAPVEMRAKIEKLTPAIAANPAFPQTEPPERTAATITPPPVTAPATPAATEKPAPIVKERTSTEAAKTNAASPKKSSKKSRPKPAPAPQASTPAPAPEAAAPAAPHVAEWTPANWPFGVGEKITWALRYGPIEGGVATLQVEEPKILNGEPVLHYRGAVKSSKMLEFFYKVDDEIQSWVRMKDHVPLRQEIRQLESSRWGRRIVAFDPAGSKAKYFASFTKSNGGSEQINREDAVTPWAQDIFGALYFYRFANNLQSHINFPIHDRWKNWNNEITYVGDETIHVPAGDFETMHFKMFPRVTGYLQPKGDVEIWLWKNPSNIIVRFKAKIKVGSITGDLRAYEPGKPLAFSPPVMKTPLNLTAMGEVPKPASN